MKAKTNQNVKHKKVFTFVTRGEMIKKSDSKKLIAVIMLISSKNPIVL